MKTKEMAAVVVTASTLGLIAVEASAGALVSATVTAASDYLADGVSASDNKPVLQLGVDLVHSRGFYAGVWASNIDSNAPSSPNLEFDLAAGYQRELLTSWLSGDVGVARYTYHEVDDRKLTDYNEWYVGVTVAENTSAYYYLAKNDEVWDGWQRRTILSHTQPVTDTFSLLVTAEHLGYEQSIAEDYNAWLLGVSQKWQGIDFTLSYRDNDIDDGGDTARDRVVLEVSRSFDLAEF